MASGELEAEQTLATIGRRPVQQGRVRGDSIRIGCARRCRRRFLTFWSASPGEAAARERGL